MTISILSAQIEAAREAFRSLNDSRKLLHSSLEFPYAPLTEIKEHKLIELAERIERLYRFRSQMMAKEALPKDLHDWITPEDFQNSNL